MEDFVKKEHEQKSLNVNNTDKEKQNSTLNKLMDNKLQLISDFGTQKAKKAASNMKSHIVDEENISSVNAMKKILEENAKTQESLVVNNAEEQIKNKILNMREILPEFDLEATEPKNIFKLDSSILFL